jgi:hypothetical protein
VRDVVPEDHIFQPAVRLESLTYKVQIDSSGDQTVYSIQSGGHADEEPPRFSRGSGVFL